MLLWYYVKLFWFSQPICMKIQELEGLKTSGGRGARAPFASNFLHYIPCITMQLQSAHNPQMHKQNKWLKKFPLGLWQFISKTEKVTLLAGRGSLINEQVPNTRN